MQLKDVRRLLLMYINQDQPSFSKYNIYFKKNEKNNYAKKVRINFKM